INFVFVFWLAVLFTANLLMHFEALGWTEATARTGYLLGVDTMVMVMVLMGGRVIPAFTQNAVPGVVITRRKPIELTALGSTALYLVVDLFDRGMMLT